MSQKRKSNRIIDYLQRIMGLLPKRRKRQFFVLLGGMVFVALIETVSLGLLSVFATSLSSPEEVLTSDAYEKVAQYITFIRGISGEQLILCLSIAVVVAIIAKNAVRGYVQYWVSRFAAVVQGHVGSMSLRKFLEVDYEWHLRQNPHDLLIILAWRDRIGQFVNSSLTIVNNSILVLIMMVSIVVIQPVLMPFMIVILGTASYYIYKIVRKRIDRNSRVVRDLTQAANLDGAKAIHGMKDIRIFGLERSIYRDYAEKVFKLSRNIGLQNVLTNMPTWIMESVGFFFLSAAIVIMLFVMNLSRIEIFGTLSLLAVAAWRVLPAINRIIGGLSRLRVTFPFIDRIYELIDDVDNTGILKISGDKNAQVYDPDVDMEFFKSSLTFKNVSFRYTSAERDALTDISCEIPKGSTVGIIGHSGAGKSTFVDLFIGLLRPTSGVIRIDDEVLDDTILRKWRSNIGYVPQFPYIYDCSLAENVAFAEPGTDPDDGRILGSCNEASIDFIGDLSDGIQTRIGERGLLLSGGQKQRVAIARSIYMKPSVLVFDEATSALDSQSERSIQKTIESFKGDQTILIIAHRLTTVRHCDFLVWLERGRIVKIGAPDEILEEYETLN